MLPECPFGELRVRYQDNAKVRLRKLAFPEAVLSGKTPFAGPRPLYFGVGSGGKLVGNVAWGKRLVRSFRSVFVGGVGVQRRRAGTWDGETAGHEASFGKRRDHRGHRISGRNAENSATLAMGLVVKVFCVFSRYFPPVSPSRLGRPDDRKNG